MIADNVTLLMLIKSQDEMTILRLARVKVKEKNNWLIWLFAV